MHPDYCCWRASHRIGLPSISDRKAALDVYRAASDVRRTYVSPPGRIAPGERMAVYRPGRDDLLVDANGESSISMEDYAVAVIDEAKSQKHSGRRFTVAH
jgi:putative NADH-flavin reductase